MYFNIYILNIFIYIYIYTHRITCYCIIKVKKMCQIINDSDNQNWKSTLSAISFPFTLLTFVSLCCLSLTNHISLCCFSLSFSLTKAQHLCCLFLTNANKAILQQLLTVPFFQLT